MDEPGSKLNNTICTYLHPTSFELSFKHVGFVRTSLLDAYNVYMPQREKRLLFTFAKFSTAVHLSIIERDQWCSYIILSLQAVVVDVVFVVVVVAEVYVVVPPRGDRMG